MELCHAKCSLDDMLLLLHCIYYRLSGLAIEIDQVLDRCYKQSRAVDTESLCIVAGEKVE